MNVLFIGVRKNEDEIISGPQKVSNFLYNNIIKKHDNVYYYGIYEDEVPEDPTRVVIINDMEVKGPVKGIESFIKSKEIDVVYFARYHTSIALYLIYLKFKYRFKLTYTVHGIVKKEAQINKSFKFYHGMLEGFFLSWCDRIIVISHALRDELLKYHPNLKKEKIEIINNGVSVIPVREKIDIRNFYGLNSENKIIFTAGIRKIKNIEELIEGFINNSNLYRKAYLLIAGENDTEYANYIINKYKNYSNIKFIGLVNPNQMSNIYNQCDLYVQISEFETFGMSIVEALLHKRKILISKHLPIAQYFEKDEIYLYDREKDDLGNLIISCLENKETINIKGYERAVKLFDWENISEEYYKVFEDVCRFK